MDANVSKTLFKKAGELLARRSHSRGELKDELLKFAGPAQVETTLDRLESLHLLNDAEYAYNFALDRMKRRGWSPAKTFDALVQRRVQQNAIEAVLARIQNEEGEKFSLQSCIERYCSRKGLPSNPKDVGKLISRLRRRGFDEDDIISALKQAISGANSQRFETGE